MRPRDEVETAYFALLRAQEELADLQRYEEYLGDEVRRLRRFLSEGRAHEDTIAGPYRRRIVHTQRPLQEAVESRIETCTDELGRMESRMLAAESFVQECERRHEHLRQG